jgi:hypothetical protein
MKFQTINSHLLLRTKNSTEYQNNPGKVRLIYDIHDTNTKCIEPDPKWLWSNGCVKGERLMDLKSGGTFNNAANADLLLPPSEWTCQNYKKFKFSQYDFDHMGEYNDLSDDLSNYLHLKNQYSSINSTTGQVDHSYGIPIFSEVVHTSLVNIVNETGWLKYTSDRMETYNQLLEVPTVEINAFGGLRLRTREMHVKDDVTDPNSYLGRWYCPYKYRVPNPNYKCGAKCWDNGTPHRDLDGNAPIKSKTKYSDKVGNCFIYQAFPKQMLSNVAVVFAPDAWRTDHWNMHGSENKYSRNIFRERVRIKGRYNITSAGLGNDCWECVENATTKGKCMKCHSICRQYETHGFHQQVEDDDSRRENYCYSPDKIIDQSKIDYWWKMNKNISHLHQKDPNFGYKSIAWYYAISYHGFKRPSGLYNNVLNCRHSGITGNVYINK